MGRLIDADSLKEKLKNYEMDIVAKATIMKVIDWQPTAYDPEEVVKQLEVQKAIAFITLANN